MTYFMLLSLLLFSGCGLIKEAKTDAAIVGMTGWGVNIGINSVATPMGTALPIPSIMIWRGTMFRVGVTESAEIKTGETIKAATGSGADSSNPTTQTEGVGSLSIKTKDTSKALEKMKDLYSVKE